jgi:hypothetical protein
VSRIILNELTRSLGPSSSAPGYPADRAAGAPCQAAASGDTGFGEPRAPGALHARAGLGAGRVLGRSQADFVNQMVGWPAIPDEQRGPLIPPEG